MATSRGWQAVLNCGLSYRISAFALTSPTVPALERHGLPVLCQSPCAAFKPACLSSSNSTGAATYSSTSSSTAAVGRYKPSTNCESHQPGARCALPGRSLRQLCNSTPAYHHRNDSHRSYTFLDEDHWLTTAYPLPKLFLHKHHHRPCRRVSVTRRDLPRPPGCCCAQLQRLIWLRQSDWGYSVSSRKARTGPRG